MDSFVVSIPEIALPHQVDHPDVIVGEAQQFITEEDCIRVVMQVKVIYCQFIQSLQALISQDMWWEWIELREEVLGVSSVVRLQQLS